MRNVVRNLIAAFVAAFSVEGVAQDYDEAMEGSLQVVPATARAGDVVELQMTLKINSPWHVYADKPGSTGQRPLNLEMNVSEGVDAVGNWLWPRYETVFEGYEAHIFDAGEHVFKRKFKVTRGSGRITFDTQVTYQACNPEFCAPVDMLELAAELHVDALSEQKAAIGTASTAPAPASTWAMGASIGGTSLDMKFTALDGRKFDATELRGKVVLYDFWAMWCVPCVAELPNVKAMHEKYGAHGFEVIGVNFDGADARAKLLDFIQARGLAWPQRFDGKPLDREAARHYGVKGIPATFLIDRRGYLVEINVKGAALEPAVLKHLGQ